MFNFPCYNDDGDAIVRCVHCKSNNEENTKICAFCQKSLTDEKTFEEKYSEFEKKFDISVNNIIYTLFTILAIYIGIDIIFYIIDLLVSKIFSKAYIVLNKLELICIVLAIGYYVYRKFYKKKRK